MSEIKITNVKGDKKFQVNFSMLFLVCLRSSVCYIWILNQDKLLSMARIQKLYYFILVCTIKTSFDHTNLYIRPQSPGRLRPVFIENSHLVATEKTFLFEFYSRHIKVQASPH